MVTRRQYRALEARVEVLERESQRRAEISAREIKVFYSQLSDAVSGEMVRKALPGRRQTAGKGAVVRIGDA